MNKKGFSLIELMMVIVIVGIASTIIIAQYSNSRNSKALSLGAKQVVNDVRMTQNYTFGALADGGTNPSGGYGVRFSDNTNPGSYIIFGDQDSGEYDYDAGEEFQTINLPEGVTVTSLDIGATNYSDIDVVFTPPYGEVYIDKKNKDGAPPDFIDLEVEISNSAGSRVINISSSRKIN